MATELLTVEQLRMYMKKPRQELIDHCAKNPAQFDYRVGFNAILAYCEAREAMHDALQTAYAALSERFDRDHKQLGEALKAIKVLAQHVMPRSEAAPAEAAAEAESEDPNDPTPTVVQPAGNDVVDKTPFPAGVSPSGGPALRVAPPVPPPPSRPTVNKPMAPNPGAAVPPPNGVPKDGGAA